MANVNVLSRIFKFKEKNLEDINPSFSPEQILSFYSNTYPELTNAHLIDIGVNGKNYEYEFKTVAGTKG